MKRYNVSVPSKYTDKNSNEEKTKWSTVGTMVHFDPSERNPEGNYLLELNMFPDTKFMLFEQKPREDGQGQAPPQTQQAPPQSNTPDPAPATPASHDPADEIDVKDIPF